MNISRESHLKFAFVIWVLVGTGLLSAGSMFLFGGRMLPLTDISCSGIMEWSGLLIAFVLGFLKGKFVLTKIGRKNIARIEQLPDASPFYRTFSLRSWMLVLLMIVIGRTIRFLGAPYLVVGVIYIAVGFALLLGSRTYLERPGFLGGDTGVEGGKGAG